MKYYKAKDAGRYARKYTDIWLIQPFIVLDKHENVIKDYVMAVQDDLSSYSSYVRTKGEVYYKAYSIDKPLTKTSALLLEIENGYLLEVDNEIANYLLPLKG